MTNVSRDVLLIGVQRGGYLKGARVAKFVTEWNMAEAEFEREIGIEEFVAWDCAPSRATAYRRQSEFRELFPEFATPAGMAQQPGWARLVQALESGDLALVDVA